MRYHCATSACSAAPGSLRSRLPVRLRTLADVWLSDKSTAGVLRVVRSDSGRTPGEQQVSRTGRVGRGAAAVACQSAAAAAASDGRLPPANAIEAVENPVSLLSRLARSRAFANDRPRIAIGGCRQPATRHRPPPPSPSAVAAERPNERRRAAPRACLANTRPRANVPPRCHPCVCFREAVPGTGSRYP